MKRISVIALLAGLFFLGFMSESSARPMCIPTKGISPTSGSGPWPFKNELPFPWKEIRGVWMANIDGCETLFTFTPAKKTQNGSKVLDIEQYNGLTCDMEAQGKGFEKERVVMAFLDGWDMGPQEVSIHLFKGSDIKSVRASTKENVVVMKMKAVGSRSEPKVFPITKIENDPELVCR